jgi:hypothetical protein
MLAPSGDLLRVGLGLKLNQVKRATQSYLRDRTSQATGTVTAYAIAAGLFAAAGVFLIAATLVGAIAMFRWIEIRYGMFWAFGAIGGLLVAIAAICAGLAAAKLKAPAAHFPSLTSRLRVAIKANPLRPAPADAAQDTAAAILSASPAPSASRGRAQWKSGARSGATNRNVQAGLAVAALLLGWAAARRQQTRRTNV